MHVLQAQEQVSGKDLELKEMEDKLKQREDELSEKEGMLKEKEKQLQEKEKELISERQKEKESTTPDTRIGMSFLVLIIHTAKLSTIDIFSVYEDHFGSRAY